MIRTEPINKIMTENVIAIEPTQTLDTAKSVFRKHHIRHLPVVQDNELVGILSLTDLQRISFATLSGDGTMTSDSAMLEMFTVSQVMRKEPVTVTVDQSIAEVAEILAEKEFHALPVLGDDKLVGIITTTDLIRYMLDQEMVK